METMLPTSRVRTVKMRAVLDGGACWVLSKHSLFQQNACRYNPIKTDVLCLHALFFVAWDEYCGEVEPLFRVQLKKK